MSEGAGATPSNEELTGTVYAEPEHLADVWRPLDSTEENVARNLLIYTSALLRHNVPGLDDKIEDGKVQLLLVRLATVWIVRRVMVNPEAARQQSWNAGPFTHSITVDSALSSGALYVSDSDLAMFMPVIPKGTKIGTARVRPGSTFGHSRRR